MAHAVAPICPCGASHTIYVVQLKQNTMHIDIEPIDFEIDNPPYEDLEDTSEADFQIQQTFGGRFI